ncbi:sensor histidine kinase [Psychromicrobium lacuslunae]|uniref:sensor histidine kinase n=1 Tax=Psychromicrobium lacuslunae TaxID=1618207 RepID=UPI0006963EFB|nr:HAMP domain-containing sensor histidine kinase [Psychromicrobium lacuslunae]
MKKVKQLFGSLSFRLGVGFALIAAIAAGTVGAATTWSARANILEAEQNRLLDDFNAIYENLPSSWQRDSVAGKPQTDEQIFNQLLGLRGPTVLSLPALGLSHGMLPMSEIPESFRPPGLAGVVPSFARISEGGVSYYLVSMAKQVNIFESSGRPEAVPGSGRPTSAPASPSATPSDVGPEPGEATQNVMTVVLYAKYPLDKQDAQINSLTLNAGLLTLTVGLAAAFIGVLLSRQLLRPVLSLQKAVEDLGASGEAAEIKPSGVSELSGVINSFNDTSSRLHQSMTELEASEARAKRFVADVAHELRTPTAAMLATADVLDSPDTAPEDTAEAAKLTASASRRLAILIEDLLEISRLDAGQISLQRQRFDVAERLQLLITERGWLTLVSLESEGSSWIESDPRRFDVVIGNLVSNALNHGGGKARIILSALGDDCEIAVEDSGAGIPPDELPQLFDRFYKSDLSRHRGSTGLGLSLVKENLRVLGGSISVRSGSTGSTFTVTLPTSPGSSSTQL